MSSDFKTYYRAFNANNHSLYPSKEEYDAYQQPTIIVIKDGIPLLRPKEYIEMTPKQKAYHSWIMKYFIAKVQPYLCEVE